MMWSRKSSGVVFRVLFARLNGARHCSNTTSIAKEYQGIQEQNLPFASAKIGRFFQTQPLIKNQYLEDKTLKTFLTRYLPKSILDTVEEDLTRFGERVSTELCHLGLQCDQELPYVQYYDPWGTRVDKLVTSPAWRKMHDISAEEGIVALGYLGDYGEYRRLHQMAKVYLFAPVSGLYWCPVAMTDGAATMTQNLALEYPWLKERAFPHLTSRNPEEFWTSGQWMTERRGGSDVANGTETVAVEQSDGSYKLYGYKWFSSATDADMTFTLARVTDSQGHTTGGTRGLSLFYLEVRDGNGNLNNIQIQKLKNKLGTRQVPTAELLLDGTVAYKVSEDGRGVAGISNMLKLSRLHNALAAAGSMRRMCSLARDYSTRREAFGNTLKNYPLHIQTLSRMEIETRAATLLTFEGVRLLGREDSRTATKDEVLMLRLLTPLIKLYTAKQAIQVNSEGIESFGGQGYIEDTGIPALLRDGQVLSIWEGTTNILSLDVLRAIVKTQGSVLEVWHKDVIGKITNAKDFPQLQTSSQTVEKSANKIIEFVSANQDKLQTAARDFAYSLARTYTGALLIEHAMEGGMSETDIYTAQRWCEKDLCPVLTNHSRQHYDEAKYQQEFNLVFEDYHDEGRL